MAAPRNYEPVNTAAELRRLPFFAALPSAFTRARISAGLRGQAPVTVSASPVSQEREAWIFSVAGLDVELSGTLSLTPQGRHLYVSVGLAGVHPASFDPRGGPPAQRGWNDFYLLTSTLDLCASEILSRGQNISQDVLWSAWKQTKDEKNRNIRQGSPTRTQHVSPPWFGIRQPDGGPIHGHYSRRGNVRDQLSRPFSGQIRKLGLLGMFLDHFISLSLSNFPQNCLLVPLEQQKACVLVDLTPIISYVIHSFIQRTHKCRALC